MASIPLSPHILLSRPLRAPSLSPLTALCPQSGRKRIPDECLDQPDISTGSWEEDAPSATFWIDDDGDNCRPYLQCLETQEQHPARQLSARDEPNYTVASAWALFLRRKARKSYSRVMCRFKTETRICRITDTAEAAAELLKATVKNQEARIETQKATLETHKAASAEEIRRLKLQSSQASKQHAQSETEAQLPEGVDLSEQGRGFLRTLEATEGMLNEVMKVVDTSFEHSPLHEHADHERNSVELR